MCEISLDIELLRGGSATNRATPFESPEGTHIQSRFNKFFRIFLKHCKIKCIFYCHRIVRIIAPLFCKCCTQTLWLVMTQLSNGVDC